MPGIVPAANERDPEILARAIRHLAETGFDLSILNAITALATDDTFPFYDTSTGLNAKVALANLALAVSPALAPLSGQLSFSSSTALIFKPFNGDRIRIAGVLYQIPSGGIAGLANTSVFVNGAAGQNLAANTNYLICAFNNSGTVTADFITTITHARDATALNEGTEIKNGDASRSVIGLCRTDGSSQFSDALTLGWFNKRLKRTSVTAANGSTTATTPFPIISITALNWQDDPVWLDLHIDASVTGGVGIVDRGVDGTETGPTVALGTTLFHIVCDGWLTMSEGAHTLAGFAYIATAAGPTLSYFNPYLEIAVFG